MKKITTLFVSLLFASQAFAYSFSEFKNDIQKLKDKVQPKDEKVITKTIRVLEEMRAQKHEADPEAFNVPGRKFRRVSQRTLVEMDDQQKIQKLYDLALPTIKKGNIEIGKVPLVKFGMKDFYTWIVKEDKDKVIAKMEEAMGLSDSELIASSWYGKLFPPEKDENGETVRNNTIRSFTLGDILKTEELHVAGDILELLEEVPGAREFIPVLQDPNTFWKNLRFNWDKKYKVFKVTTAADLFPVVGPVVFYDSNMWHRFAEAKAARFLVRYLIKGIALTMEETIALKLAVWAISQVFHLVEEMYTYHLNQQIGLLESAVAGRLAMNVEKEEMLRVLSVLYINRMGALDIIDGFIEKEFKDPYKYGLERRKGIIKKQGEARKWNHKKLKKKCDTQDVISGFYSVCRDKKGVPKYISDLSFLNKFLMFKLKPVKIYSFKHTQARIVHRIMNQILAATASLLIPYVGGEVAKIFKHFSKNGKRGEANLLGYLREAGYRDLPVNELSNKNRKRVMKQLFIQHINPFLTFKQKREDKIIKANLKTVADLI